MNESDQPKRKADGIEQEGVVNIGDISSISGSKIDIAAEDSKPVETSQDVSTSDVEGSTFIEGSVQTGGGDFVGRDKIVITASQEEFFHLLMTINEKIDEEDASPEEKDDLHILIREIAHEAEKGESGDESVLTRRLRMLGKVSPDIYDVFLETFGSADLGTSSAMKTAISKLMSDIG